MIIGVGTDLCEISRMAGLLQDTAFLKRYFDPREQAYILLKGVFAASAMAGIFAAKEAFVKALRKGFDGIRPEDILVLHREGGAPYYELQGSAQSEAKKQLVTKSHLSISHEGGLAVAFCVLEGGL